MHDWHQSPSRDRVSYVHNENAVCDLTARGPESLRLAGQPQQTPDHLHRALHTPQMTLRCSSQYAARVTGSTAPANTGSFTQRAMKLRSSALVSGKATCTLYRWRLGRWSVLLSQHRHHLLNILRGAKLCGLICKRSRYATTVQSKVRVLEVDDDRCRLARTQLEG